MRRLAIVFACLAALGCGGTDQATELDTTEAEPMTVFDPDAAGATLDFTDGVTTVAANFLNALEPRFGSGKDAWNGLEDGATGLIVDQNPTTLALEPLVETAVTGTYTDNEWAINATHLFCVKGGTGLTVELRDIEDFAVLSPAVEYTASWAAGDIDFIIASELYLIIAGNDSGAGVDKIDVIDLNAGSIVGTYSLPASHVTLGSYSAVFYGTKLFVHMYDGSANYLIAALNLGTATLDTSWATSGFATLTYASGHIQIDQRYLYHFAGDDCEILDPEDGSSLSTQAGLGTGTTFANAAKVDGKSRVVYYQATGSEYLGVFRIADGVSLATVFEHTMSNNHSAQINTDGEFMYLDEAGTAGVIKAFRIDDGSLWGQGPAAYTQAGKLEWDGLHLITVCTTAGGAGVDGFARIKAPQQARRVRKQATSSKVRGPWDIGLVPL